MKKKEKTTTPEPGYVYVVRTCNADMSSHDGFVWPKSGPVECPAPDPKHPGRHWIKNTQCGNGLHGLLDAKGSASHWSKEQSANWLVVKVLETDIVDLGDKVKFPRGEVVFCGTRDDALAFLPPELILPENAKASVASSRNYANASTTGQEANASTTGQEANASTSGNYAHASTSGYKANASTTGNYAHASTSGNYAHASTSGYKAHASTTGNYAHASTSGYKANASTTGKNSIAAALHPIGKVASKFGPLVSSYIDGSGNIRVLVGYVGEDLKPATWYRASATGWIDLGPANLEVAVTE